MEQHQQGASNQGQGQTVNTPLGRVGACAGVKGGFEERQVFLRKDGG